MTAPLEFGFYLKIYRKENESLEINKLEVKGEFDDIIKVFNPNRGKIVNPNSWKPLFCMSYLKT